MIDIHSHVIPEVDDGAGSWDESLAMCKMAWQDGIKTVVATPHAWNGVYEADPAFISVQISLLTQKLRDEHIGLEILQGAEVHSRPDLAALIPLESSFTLNGNGRYFLLEFPHSIVPPDAARLIFELLLCHLTPIIVHPERNLHVQSNTDILAKLVHQGALCQVTAMSLTGEFGKRAFDCAWELAESDCVHLVATDAHNAKARIPVLSRAREAVSKRMGAQKTEEIFDTMPKMVVFGTS